MEGKKSKPIQRLKFQSKKSKNIPRPILLYEDSL